MSSTASQPPKRIYFDPAIVYAITRAPASHAVLKSMWYENDPVYDPDILPEEPREVQLEIMEAWFRYRYEEPAERTP